MSEESRDRTIFWIITSLASVVVLLISAVLTVMWNRIDAVREKDRQHESRVANLEGKVEAVLESIQHEP